jgi:hypothetical protein
MADFPYVCSQRANQPLRHRNSRGFQSMKKKLVLIAIALGCILPAAATDSKAAATPPMGWNSWNHFACKVTAADVRSAADAIASNGMKDAGYIYVNIDDCKSWLSQISIVKRIETANSRSLTRRCRLRLGSAMSGC